MVRPLVGQAGAGFVKPLCRRARDGKRLVRRRSGRRSAQEADRPAGPGQERGLPTLVATNKGNRWVFVYGFPKSERSNIDKDEAEALKKLATHLLSLSAQAVARAKQAGELIEVDCDAND